LAKSKQGKVKGQDFAVNVAFIKRSCDVVNLFFVPRYSFLTIH